MGFNTFRGDNRTFAVIVLVPAADHELRVLRHEPAWRAACSAITPLDVMTSTDYARPITDVMPMGGLMNVDRTGDPVTSGIAAVGDAFCHTDPAFAYGLSFALLHAHVMAHATAEAPDIDAIVERYRVDRDGSYPLFSFVGALAAAPHDDDVLRRTIRRIGLLDRTAVFDEDAALHERIETILESLTARAPSPPWPPREELVARIAADDAW